MRLQWDIAVLGRCKVTMELLVTSLDTEFDGYECGWRLNGKLKSAYLSILGYSSALPAGSYFQHSLLNMTWSF